MGLTQDQFFQAVASRQIPRIRVAGIVVDDGKVLVQKPADDPSSCVRLLTEADTYSTGLATVR